MWWVIQKMFRGLVTVKTKTLSFVLFFKRWKPVSYWHSTLQLKRNHPPLLDDNSRRNVSEWHLFNKEICMLISTALDLKCLSSRVFKYLRVCRTKDGKRFRLFMSQWTAIRKCASAAIKYVAIVILDDSCFEFYVRAFRFHKHKYLNIAPSDTGSSTVGRVSHRRFFWLSHSAFSWGSHRLLFI